jgi:hypothetical protein
MYLLRMTLVNYLAHSYWQSNRHVLYFLCNGVWAQIQVLPHPRKTN